MAYTDQPDDIEAYVTDQGRAMIARGLMGEISFKLEGFSVGRGGFNPSDPVHILPVNTADQTLTAQCYPANGNAAFASVEMNTPTVVVYNCRLPATVNPTDADAALGELGVWARILNSSNPIEVNQTFLFAIAHFPIQVKTRRDVFLKRVVVSY